jgi:hypothetical protein
MNNIMLLKARTLMHDMGREFETFVFCVEWKKGDQNQKYIVSLALFSPTKLRSLFITGRW